MNRKPLQLVTTGSHQEHITSTPPLTARVGVVLIGARCFPVLVRALDSYAIGPNNPQEGFGGQYCVVFLELGTATASRPTGTVGGCGCMNELVTSIRNGQGPCT